MLTFGICSENYKANKIKTLLVLYVGLTTAVVSGMLWLVLRVPYRLERIYAFISPEKYSMNRGWQYCMLARVRDSSIFIGNGGSFYDAKGKSFQLLPGTDSDFIFTFILGSLGWIFGALLILLLGAIIIRLFMSTFKIRDPYGKFLCIGACCVFSFQVFMNVSMNIGLLPTTSIVLPFISFGGGGNLLNMALLGLFMGVYRRKEMISYSISD